MPDCPFTESTAAVPLPVIVTVATPPTKFAVTPAPTKLILLATPWATPSSWTIKLADPLPPVPGAHAVPFHTNACPVNGSVVLVSTSLSESILVAANLVSNNASL